MDDKTIEKQMQWTRWLFGAALVAITAAFAVAAVAWFDISKYRAPDAWGQLGDYFGGVLNPLVGACTLYWLLVSVRIQRKELSETRDALTKTQGAAEEQAKLALLSNQVQSLNIRLSFISGEIDYHRRSRQLYIEIANRGPVTGPVFNLRGEKVTHPQKAIEAETKAIDDLELMQLSIITQLQELMLTSNVEP